MVNITKMYDTFADRHVYDGDLLELAADVLGRMDSATEDELLHAMDDGLIYTVDRWTMLKAYCTPEDANFDVAWDYFYNDLWACVTAGALEYTL